MLDHPEVQGPVDLIWGNDRGGLQHIDGKHPGAADRMPEMWQALKRVSDSANRTVLESGQARAVVQKDFFGEPKNWLNTFFEPGKAYDQPGGKRIGGAADSGPTSSNRLIEPNLGPSLPAAKPSQWLPFGWLPALSLELRRQQDGKPLQ
ncbi:hypothetical protein [Bradyrhizobium sp. WD16]|uniref:hypothetical protein n=1 Tax=Bradyrhizobium sp. WD16 TaxID=1521768 RepID=UPI0020A25628|nr:hypothetical protein [Bradyrhizobium sp. WD16]UTD28245.1 hypothetical protein DB459_16425 [Bradyrhizobium sp. WD16]